MPSAEHTAVPDKSPPSPSLSRRTLTAGSAWAVPALALGAAAPAAAASLQACPQPTCFFHDASVSSIRPSGTLYQVVQRVYEYDGCPDGPSYPDASAPKYDLGPVRVAPDCVPAGTAKVQARFLTLEATDLDGVKHVAEVIESFDRYPDVFVDLFLQPDGSFMRFSSRVLGYFYTFPYGGYGSCLPRWNQERQLREHTFTYQVRYLDADDQPLTADCIYSGSFTVRKLLSEVPDYQPGLYFDDDAVSWGRP